MDEVAVAEVDAGDEAADPGANLDFLDGLEASGELVPIRHGALDRLRDRDRRCARPLAARLFAAAGKASATQDDQRSRAGNVRGR